MATADSYYANSMTVTLSKSAGGAVSVAGLQDVTMNVTKEGKPLYTMDSIIRANYAQIKLKVDVKVKYAIFDGAELGLLFGTTTADIDVFGATAAGRTRVSVNDTNVPVFFDLSGIVTNGSNTFQARVTNVVFNEVPLNFPENEWIGRELTGEGDNFFSDAAT